MVFAIIIIVLIGVVAFFHYTQGFWSATLSAVCAVFAAALAVGYHENVVNTLLKGQMSDQANAIALIAVFALTYLILRIIFDKAIPGNIRLPHIVDGIGGAVGGLIAGVFGVGIVMIAFQSMPFGPSIGGYARYELIDKRDVTVANEQNRGINRIDYEELKNKDFGKEQTGLILPVDDIVLGMAKRLSNGGALAGQRPLESVHPDLLQELFGLCV